MALQTASRMLPRVARIVALLCAFGAAAPVCAADAEYQLLVVACSQQDCKRIAEPRVAAKAGGKAAYTQPNMRVEIETLAARLGDADANVMVEIAHRDAARGGLSDARRTQLMLPCRVTSQTLTSLATFVADGVIYHVWAKMLPATVAALR